MISRLLTLSRAAATVAILVPMAGCSLAAGDSVESVSETLSSKCPPSVPSALAVPDGNKLGFFFDAVGVQIYVCTQVGDAFSWVFRAPEASLLNPGGQLAGTHFAGPTWEANDGSRVVGARMAGFTADATAIPWLLLRAISHEGDGRMSKITYIQRLDTAGGLAPTAGCDASHTGAEARIDYAATYFFYEVAEGQSGQRCD